MKYRTKSGDVLDAVCRSYYGPDNYSVEAVYAANTGLAAYGPVLPSGVYIKLPDASPTPTSPQPVRLWD